MMWKVCELFDCEVGGVCYDVVVMLMGEEVMIWIELYYSVK